MNQAITTCKSMISAIYSFKRHETQEPYDSKEIFLIQCNPCFSGVKSYFHSLSVLLLNKWKFNSLCLRN